MSKLILPFHIDTHLVTTKAKENMIDIHSEKLIKAWLDCAVYTNKIEELEREYKSLSPETLQKIEDFVTNRQKHPEQTGLPEEDIHRGVTLKIALDSLKGNLDQSREMYDTCREVIENVRNINI